MRYVLGVDGGSSKTHALIVSDEGVVVGFGRAGVSNHQLHGLKRAVHEIKKAVSAALENTKCDPKELVLGCYCLSGADLAEDYLLLQKAVEALGLTGSVVIKNDTMAALRAGLTKSWGVVVICGAGFNAAGRSPDGHEIVLPALGPISGDWGGGADLSQEIIRLVMRAWDGRGNPTLLTSLVLDFLRIPSVDILLSNLYHQNIDRQRLLDLVPLLFKAAEAGDKPAKELVIRMANEVAITASTIIHRLSINRETVEVVLGGSVFKGEGTLLIDTIKRVIHRQVPHASILRPYYEPVVGAALLALETIGVPIDQPFLRQLESTLPHQLIQTSYRA